MSAAPALDTALRTVVPIALLVLSERFDFHRETVASLVLISSAGGAVTLNVWLKLLA